ncbi:MAG: methionyl-tRNA formyltransferase [Candidatus Dojkabacteria bacterium]|jgi:methionyl-tRNA formyltransferase
MRNLIEEPVKVLFLGTGWESVETLKALHSDSRFDVIGAITTVDKLVGRKQIATPSDVKVFCLENNIPVFHTENNKDRYIKALEKFKPEMVVCKAFGEIVPKVFLDYPKYGCINIHFSILPKYRGAVPIQKAILDGEKETGISIMLMSEGLDEGDVLHIEKEDILDTDTNLSLRKRLVKKSALILGNILEKWVNGEIGAVEQDHKSATYCWQKDISKEKAEIKLEEQSPIYIERMVRAFIPWPIAWCRINASGNKGLDGKVMKIFEAELVEVSSSRDVGTLFSKDGMLLFVTIDPHICLRVKELQIEGKTKVKEKDFLNGLGKSL